jgi:hypothetical protein
VIGFSVHIGLGSFLEGLKDFVCWGNIFLTGPKICLKGVCLSVVEKQSLLIDDRVDWDQGILKFVGFNGGMLIIKSHEISLLRMIFVDKFSGYIFGFQKSDSIVNRVKWLYFGVSRQGVSCCKIGSLHLRYK